MYEKTAGYFLDPEIVASHFHLREGDVVADFGAGSGHYMRPLARLVGKSGIVYMCEIQKPLVEVLGTRAQAERLSQVRPLWVDIETVGGTKLKDASIDVGLVSNTLFQITDKASFFSEMGRTIRKGGKLLVIDWSDAYSALGPRPDQAVSESDVRLFAEQAGFTFERSFPAGDHHYGLAFRKI